MNEAELNFSTVSAKTMDIIGRWRSDLAYTPPEAKEWRWSIIALELDTRLNNNIQETHNA